LHAPGCVAHRPWNRFSASRARLAHVKTGAHDALAALNGALIMRRGGLQLNHLTEFTKNFIGS